MIQKKEKKGRVKEGKDKKRKRKSIKRKGQVNGLVSKERETLHSNFLRKSCHILMSLWKPESRKMCQRGNLIPLEG